MMFISGEVVESVVLGGAAIRACYWSDGQGDLLLTGVEHCRLSDDELEREARDYAAAIGLDLSRGWLEVGEWRVKG